MVDKINRNQVGFLEALEKSYQKGYVYPRHVVEEFDRNTRKKGTPLVTWRERLELYKLAFVPRRGIYDFASLMTNESNELKMVRDSLLEAQPYVPERDTTYVRQNNGLLVEKIIKSKRFAPTMIVGLSGMGKTLMVEQSCSRLEREYIRIQITPETDEDDLIGGFRLINGNTIFVNGPVVSAMKTGAILLIDEIDRGSNRLMALQGILEGKPVLIKKTGEVVMPAPGFNVFATGNTKGQGCMTGRYSAAAIIDEALLERFVMMIDHEWPTETVEKKILANHIMKYEQREKLTAQENKIIDRFVKWAALIRTNYSKDLIEDAITTRRLCHICMILSIVGKEQKAIEYGLARYEETVKESFIDLYDKINDTRSDTEIEKERSAEDEVMNNLKSHMEMKKQGI